MGEDMGRGCKNKTYALKLSVYRERKQAVQFALG